MDESKVFDKENLLKRFGGNDKILRELSKIFIDTASERMADIKNAIKNNESKLLERAAHTMKGALLTLSAGKASRIALKLEKIGEQGNLSKAEKEYQNLEKEIEKLKQVLADLK